MKDGFFLFIWSFRSLVSGRYVACLRVKADNNTNKDRIMKKIQKILKEVHVEFGAIEIEDTGHH